MAIPALALGSLLVALSVLAGFLLQDGGELMVSGLWMVAAFSVLQACYLAGAYTAWAISAVRPMPVRQSSSPVRG
jgi:hypothetical protein